MKECYEVIVQGGTFFGLGAARRHRGSIILERRTQLGWEFISSLCTPKGLDFSPSTPHGERLLAQMRRRGILGEDTFHFAGASHLMCQYALEREIPALFMTDVTQVRQKDGLYEVELVNDSGRQVIRGRAFFRCEPDRSAKEKLYHAFVVCGDGPCEAPVPWREGLVFDRCSHPGVAVAGIRVDGGLSLLEARRELAELWSRRPPRLAPWRIGVMAEEFDFISIGENHGHPLAAFEAGLEVGL